MKKEKFVGIIWKRVIPIMFGLGKSKILRILVFDVCLNENCNENIDIEILSFPEKIYLY